DVEPCIELPIQDARWQGESCLVLAQGNLPPETGSILAASTTTQSHANRDFPWFDDTPRFWRAPGRLAVSAGIDLSSTTGGGALTCAEPRERLVLPRGDDGNPYRWATCACSKLLWHT